MGILGRPHGPLSRRGLDPPPCHPEPRPWRPSHWKLVVTYLPSWAFIFMSN